MPHHLAQSLLGSDFSLYELQSSISNLKDDVKASGSFNPFSNTSLTNQINQEIKDLKSFSQALTLSGSNDQDDFQLLLERLAQTCASIEAELGEANASEGSRFQDIKKIVESDVLSDAQKQVFDIRYQELKMALHLVKFKRVDFAFCGVNVNYKSLVHPVQNFQSTWSAKKSDVDMLSLQDAKMVLMGGHNTFKEVLMMDWAAVKYQKIDHSIRERIKIKLLAVAAIGTAWGVHHVFAHNIAVAAAASKSASAAVAPKVMAMDASYHANGVVGGAHMTTTVAPVQKSSLLGSHIADAIAGCLTAIGSACAALAKDAKSNCCSDGCNCPDCSGLDSCVSACCNCGKCADCLACVIKAPAHGCESLCKVISDCISQINCSDCCPRMLDTLSQCLGHLCSGLGSCCSDTGQVCCDIITNCCTTTPNTYSSGNVNVLFCCDTSGCSSCGSGCNCACSNPFAREAHSEADVVAQVDSHREARNVVERRYVLATEEYDPEYQYV